MRKVKTKRKNVNLSFSIPGVIIILLIIAYLVFMIVHYSKKYLSKKNQDAASVHAEE